MSGPSPMASACSFLFVPGDRPERVPKALASGAHAVIVDWEDAVAPAAKVGARPGLTELLSTLPAADRARLALRINAAGTPWFEDDLELRVGPRVAFLVGSPHAHRGLLRRGGDPPQEPQQDNRDGGEPEDHEPAEENLPVHHRSIHSK